MYIWWQLGAVKYLQEHCDMKVLEDVPIMGASAGSISATLLLAKTNINDGAKLAEKLVSDYDIYDRENGIYGIWGTILRAWLEEMIPDDLSMSTVKNLHISVTPSWRFPKLLSGFVSKEDLIDAILASCHIPIFLDGRPLTQYRGQSVMDGSFWYFVTKDRFRGLPFPDSVVANDVTWIDYGDDEVFMSGISGNFLNLITPNDMYTMLDIGYEYMKRLHKHGHLPLDNAASPSKAAPRLLDWDLIFATTIGLTNNIPEELRDLPRRIRLPRMA